MGGNEMYFFGLDIELETKQARNSIQVYSTPNEKVLINTLDRTRFITRVIFPTEQGNIKG